MTDPIQTAYEARRSSIAAGLYAPNAEPVPLQANLGTPVTEEPLADERETPLENVGRAVQPAVHLPGHLRPGRGPRHLRGELLGQLGVVRRGQ